MARVYLADKDTLDTVNNKVGTANDAASATPGSLFAGIKQLISVLSSHVASWTSARASKIDNLDTTMSSRAAANTALSNGVWTNARAGKIDNLDATMSSRAAANTALSKNTWTDTRAGYLDRVANGMYGLEAIKNEVTAAKTTAANAQTAANSAYNKANEANNNAYAANVAANKQSGIIGKKINFM